MNLAASAPVPTADSAPAASAPPSLGRAMVLASSAALPGAVRSLLEALAASRRAVLAPAEVASLVVSPLHAASPLATRLLGGIDPFLLWSVALLALGLPKLAGLG